MTALALYTRTFYIIAFLCFFSKCFSISINHMLRLRSTGQQLHLVDDKWFDQILDHFNNLDTRTWQQRYFANSTMYRQGGPIFLSIGGEGPANSAWMSNGQWINWAQKFGAYCFLLEHRYYGKSRPTADLHVKNLEYLSSAQALADLAYFRIKISQEMGFENNKWIVFGGSYSGSLAAWFGLKYPHLISGAVASSAPLVSKVNFKEYLGVVANVINSTDATCFQSIKQAVTELNSLLNHPLGARKITRIFQLCDTLDPTVTNDIQNLHSELISNFQGVVQYNKANRKFEGAKGTNITVDVVCSIMSNESVGYAIQRYALVNSILLDAYNQTCLDYKYDKMIKAIRNITWDGPMSEGGRQWTFQTCTEFGFFQSTDYTDQPFGNGCPVDFYIKQCQDIFGPKFNLDFIKFHSNMTNILNGALNNRMSRVLLPNGSIDPWHFLGASRDLNEHAKAVYINGTAHCADMYPSSTDDSIELSIARQHIESQIADWLQ